MRRSAEGDGRTALREALRFASPVTSFVPEGEDSGRTRSKRMHGHRFGGFAAFRRGGQSSVPLLGEDLCTARTHGARGSRLAHDPGPCRPDTRSPRGTNGAGGTGTGPAHACKRITRCSGVLKSSLWSSNQGWEAAAVREPFATQHGKSSRTQGVCGRTVRSMAGVDPSIGGGRWRFGIL